MIRTYFIAALIFGAFNIHAQSNTAIEKVIRTNEQKVVKGILNADTNLLKEVWFPEFMVNTPRNNIAKDRSAVFHNQ